MRLHRDPPIGLLLSAFSTALLFLAIPCSAQQSQVGNIVGEIQVSRSGTPPKQILINLQARGAPINSAYSDDQGRFGFYALPGGVYHLSVQDDDYLPVSQEVRLDLAVSTVSHATITLNLRPGTETKSPAPRIAGSNPHAIDVNEFSRRFPKKALQEYEKGLKASGSGDTQSASRHFQKAIELAPEFYPAHNELGRTYLAKSDFGPAQSEFEEVIKLNQSDAEAHINLGNVLLLTHHYGEAFNEVQEGLRRDPESAVGHFILGSVYQKVQKLDEAERSLQQALQLDPKMHKVHLALVNLYLAAKKKPEAIGELKNFLKAAPTDPLADKAREMLKTLEQRP